MMSLSHAAALAAFAVAVATSGAALAAPIPDGKGAAATLAVVKHVCMPLLTGAKIEDVAKTAGLRNGRDGWVLPIGGKRHIEIDPPGGANPHVCSATIIHDPNAGASIVDAITAWSGRQTPALQPLKTQEKVTGALYQLTTSSWIGKAAGGDLVVVYSEDKTLDGKPVAGNLDQASLTVGLTPSAS
ncbi:MAG: hypothetical protein JWO72_1640 [Caulobacteraceae bacterium]|jgi:hypothetical protein|nr:hypothetical protein [Caulobacteraceae bacterium]